MKFWAVGASRCLAGVMVALRHLAEHCFAARGRRDDVCLRRLIVTKRKGRAVSEVHEPGGCTESSMVRTAVLSTSPPGNCESGLVAGSWTP
jgi:hypothetical protein